MCGFWQRAFDRRAAPSPTIVTRRFRAWLSSRRTANEETERRRRFLFLLSPSSEVLCDVHEEFCRLPPVLVQAAALLRLESCVVRVPAYMCMFVGWLVGCALVCLPINSFDPFTSSRRGEAKLLSSLLSFLPPSLPSFHRFFLPSLRHSFFYSFLTSVSPFCLSLLRVRCISLVSSCAAATPLISLEPHPEFRHPRRIGRRKSEVPSTPSAD